MTDEPYPIEARRLLSRYLEVSRDARYANYGTADDLAKLAADLTAKLDPARRPVAEALRELFERIRDEFDELNHGTIDWVEMDGAVLEAVHYVAKKGASNDGARIAASVVEVRRRWCGS